MNQKTENALNKILHQQPNYNRLNSLEKDVWNSINRKKQADSFWLNLIPEWKQGELQYATSLVFVLILGVTISQLSHRPQFFENNDGMRIFSVDAPYLLSNIGR